MNATDRARAHPNRPGSPWRAVAAACACSLGAVGAVASPRLGVPTAFGALAAGLAGALTVLALPSLPTRRVTVLILGIAGLGALRHAALPTTDSGLLVVWAAATLVALVLVDRAEAERAAAAPGGTPFAARVPEVVRSATAMVVLVAAVVVVAVPPLTEELGRKLWPGLLPTFEDSRNAPGSLKASRSLDMTRRPRLSDDVVFTVDSPRADFWRGETFDLWDGRTWTRSDPQVLALSRRGDTVRLAVDPFDVGAQVGEETEQTFRMEAGFSELLFAAPSAVAVRSEKLVVGRADGTAGVIGGFGKDAVYTVTSRSLLPTEADLRAADARSVPEQVLDRYAQPPIATPRVRALAERIAAGSPTTYDTIRAFEDWLGANTRYSLDAPLSPSGVDVVDHFLFESRLGWCEQVASSLVVLARSVGIPARLATGFVPGDLDPLSGRFVVRERDAHAWAEVYFPGIGWQGFDPTASVPLAGEAGDAGSWMDAARRNALQVAVVLAVLVWAVTAAPGFVGSVRRRLARRRSWPARALARLERIGRSAGRPRAPAETPREYARALAAHVGDPRLAAVGETLDRAMFSAGGVGTEEAERADEVLATAGRGGSPSGAR